MTPGGIISVYTSPSSSSSTSDTSRMLLSLVLLLHLTSIAQCRVLRSNFDSSEPAIVDTGMEFLINNNQPEGRQLEDLEKQADIDPMFQSDIVMPRVKPIPTRQNMLTEKQREELDDLRQEVESEIAELQRAKAKRKQMAFDNMEDDDELSGRMANANQGPPPPAGNHAGQQIQPGTQRRPQLARQDAFDIPDEEETELMRIRQSVERLISKKQQHSRPRRQIGLDLQDVPSPTRRKRAVTALPYDEFTEALAYLPANQDGYLATTPRNLQLLHPKSMEEVRQLSGGPRFYMSENDSDSDEDDDEEEEVETTQQNAMQALEQLDKMALLNRMKRYNNNADDDDDGYYEELLPREKLGPQRVRKDNNYNQPRLIPDPAQEFLRMRERLNKRAQSDQEDSALFDGNLLASSAHQTDAEIEQMEPAIRGRFKVCQTVKEKFHKQLAFTGKTLELDECYVSCERVEDERVFSHVFKLVDWPCGNQLEGLCLPDATCSAF